MQKNYDLVVIGGVRPALQRQRLPEKMELKIF